MKRKGNTIIVLSVIILVLVSSMFYFWLGPKIFFKQVDVAHDIVDQTYTAENAIYNYEWFKIQFEKISESEIQIDNTMMQKDEFKDLYGNVSKWDWTTKEEYNRLSTTLLGQKNHYELLIADYNARSKMANKNIFDGKLPFNVDKKMW